MKPKLKPTGTKRLKLKCDVLFSTSAVKFDLRRYNKAGAPSLGPGAAGWAGLFTMSQAVSRAGVIGRGLHSSTFQLNLSRF